MGTAIEAVQLSCGRRHSRRSALRLAVTAAKGCLEHAGVDPAELDLLVNAGIYRDRNLGEPALAAIIQADIGANTEDPQREAHGTFSFDITNGTCGILTALQIADGFLQAHTISRALLVASDADPGHGRSVRFPFSPTGAALLCAWSDGYGLGPVHWVNRPDHTENFRATVGLDGSRNVLRVHQAASLDGELAAAGAEAARRCLDESKLDLADVPLIVAAPARRRYQIQLAALLEVPADRIIVADDEQVHTASLVAAIDRQWQVITGGAPTLLVAAGAGVVAGAALYQAPPRA
jgi:3-oxoacyl-[acyl-carrier-protein] synthase-3